MVLNKKINFKKNKLELFNLEGLIKTVSTVPTYTPTKFSDQIVIYSSGGTTELYIYDNTNATWLKATLA